MNNFTKEELETLHSCLDQCKFEDGEDDELMNKLEKMIDKMGGFEQPESSEEIKETVCCGRKLFYTNALWAEPRCDKCGRNLNDNQ